MAAHAVAIEHLPVRRGAGRYREADAELGLRSEAPEESSKPRKPTKPRRRQTVIWRFTRILILTTFAGISKFVNELPPFSVRIVRPLAESPRPAPLVRTRSASVWNRRRSALVLGLSAVSEPAGSPARLGRSKRRRPSTRTSRPSCSSTAPPATAPPTPTREVSRRSMVFRGCPVQPDRVSRRARPRQADRRRDRPAHHAAVAA